MKKSKIALITTILFFVLTTVFFVMSCVLAKELYGGDAANVWWFWASFACFICSIPLLTVGIWCQVCYVCRECGEEIHPTYTKWLFTFHCGFSRRVYCHKCGKKVWGKARLK